MESLTLWSQGSFSSAQSCCLPWGEIPGVFAGLCLSLLPGDSTCYNFRERSLGVDSRKASG